MDPLEYVRQYPAWTLIAGFIAGAILWFRWRTIISWLWRPTAWMIGLICPRCRQLETMTEELRQKNEEQANAAEQKIEQLINDRDDLTAHLKKMADGKVWEVRPTPQIPPFRKRSPNNAPIVAVLSLKGGVGKTTVAGNLGATYWSHRRHVLMVDLDYQGSLSAACLSPEQKQDLHDNRQNQNCHYVRRLLNAAPAYDVVSEIRQRIGNYDAYLLAADEDLHIAEMASMIDWVVDQTSDDVRYRFREVLHADCVQERYDVILIDCPPRLTTATLNALTSSDFVLIPVIPDTVSADAVPRLLGWLRHLRTIGVCPDIDVLGVVANRAHFTNRVGVDRLSPKQKDVWKELPRKCRDGGAWNTGVHHFRATIPTSTMFADAAASDTFAALGSMKGVFDELFEEIEERMPTPVRRLR